MQFKDFWAALRRRWYLVVVVVLLAAAGCFGTTFVIGPTYQSQGSVLLLPPGSTTGGTATVGNPYLSLAGVSQARDVVIRTLMSKTNQDVLCQASGDAAYEAMRAQLCKSSPGVTYEATPDFTSSAPLIIITVEADTPANGAAALDAVANRVPVILSDLQRNLGLRDKALVTSIPVVLDREPDVLHKAQIRAGIVAIAGILAVGLLAIGLIDGTFSSRRRPSAAEEAAPSPAPAAAAPEKSAAPRKSAVPRKSATPTPQPQGWGWSQEDDSRESTASTSGSNGNGRGARREQEAGSRGRSTPSTDA